MANTLHRLLGDYSHLELSQERKANFLANIFFWLAVISLFSFFFTLFQIENFDQSFTILIQSLTYFGLLILLRNIKLNIVCHIFLILITAFLFIDALIYAEAFIVVSYFFLIPITLSFYLLEIRFGIIYTSITTVLYSICFFAIKSELYVSPLDLNKLDAYSYYGAYLIFEAIMIAIIIAYEVTRKKNNVKLNNLIEESNKSNDIITQKNNDLNEMTYVLSHDLKAPIQGIMMLSKVLKRTLEDENVKMSPEAADLFEKMDERGERMENIIAGILDYSRVGYNNKIDFFDSKEIILEIIDALSVEDVATVEVIGKNFPELQVNKSQFIQVFQNLISNAIKYNDKTLKKLKIIYMEEKEHVVFVVEDNGIGIAQSDTDEVFKLFGTIGEQSKSSTGVGLAIVKKIIESLDGEILIDSTPSIGSAFFVRFPKSILKNK